MLVCPQRQACRWASNAQLASMVLQAEWRRLQQTVRLGFVGSKLVACKHIAEAC